MDCAIALRVPYVVCLVSVRVDVLVRRPVKWLETVTAKWLQWSASAVIVAVDPCLGVVRAAAGEGDTRMFA